MSFVLSFKRNQSPPNKVEKELLDVSIGTGTLKEATSIIDPVFIGDIDQQVIPDILKNINYLYVEAFGRYYYITNIVSITNQLFEIHCHVDVLMSYKEQIKNQKAIVSRQEQKFNMMLDDGWFSTYQNPEFYTHPFSASGVFDHQEFVLVVAGS